MCTRTPRAGAIIAIAALLTMSRKSILKGLRFRSEISSALAPITASGQRVAAIPANSNWLCRCASTAVAFVALPRSVFVGRHDLQ
jgi:hypothetical protein